MWRLFIQIIAAFGVFSSAVSLSLPLAPAVIIGPKDNLSENQSAAPVPRASMSMPEVVRGIYLTASTASSGERLEKLLRLAKETEINTFVVDLKDANGRLAFAPKDETVRAYNTYGQLLGDLEKLARRLREEGIYFVGRIAVFQDPTLAASAPALALKTASGSPWRDFKGVKWVDPASREVWEYNTRLAREAAERGVDEINLDYVRFPSDGVISAIRYPFWDGKMSKADVMRAFFSFFSKELAPTGAKLSVDLFGLTAWRRDDMNIGQIMEDAASYFDAVSPMVYPSHFPAGFRGMKNPAEYPYEIVFESVKRANERLNATSSRATVRPWIQDFDLGANYDADKVRKQINASLEGGASGWMLWNARNVYTREALKNSE